MSTPFIVKQWLLAHPFHLASCNFVLHKFHVISGIYFEASITRQTIEMQLEEKGAKTPTVFTRVI